MAEFSDQEKILYLKYVWGRSRLPNPALFNFNHQIQSYGNTTNSDMKLPKATTCYFALTLPMYSSKAVLAEKLRYVITNCNEIDGDFNANIVEI